MPCSFLVFVTNLDNYYIIMIMIIIRFKCMINERAMQKHAFSICETKGEGRLRGNQRLCVRYIGILTDFKNATPRLNVNIF